MIKELINRIRRKWMKLRLQPIRVFCFHHVSDIFDETTMCREDWMSTDMFKKRIETLQKKGYVFISLQEAHDRIKHDYIRISKYAVLTADDGWTSLKNILPWLNEQQIPITLFLNPGYLEGKHFREVETEKYLTEDDVKHLYEQYPLVTIGMHGWEHVDATKQTEEEFTKSIEQSVQYLSVLPNYIPFFAYTWGRHTVEIDNVLIKREITPLTIMGGRNYNKHQILDRELLE